MALGAIGLGVRSARLGLDVNQHRAGKLLGKRGFFFFHYDHSGSARSKLCLHRVQAHCTISGALVSMFQTEGVAEYAAQAVEHVAEKTGLARETSNDQSLYIIEL